MEAHPGCRCRYPGDPGSYEEGAFRVFYVVESATDVYVLHAFQKKTQKTSPRDIEKGKIRYKLIP